MKNYVIDDGIFHQKREMISLKKGDIVVYKEVNLGNVSEILINQERNEDGELIVFLIAENGKEIASIGTPEKLEIIHDGKVCYCDENGKKNGNEGRIIKIIEQDNDVIL